MKALGEHPKISRFAHCGSSVHLCALQCVAVCSCVLQCAAVCCKVRQLVNTRIYCVEVCCSVLQCVTV